ncbi:YybH family protein [Portibacter marinus]|uniref:YybH family protein n=1 Tax=Portibacter marinus TaxID=2898660 RepID=UPI001F308DE8|nr:nuclear transport factor 2 family protein [Portibacter marinus]
MKSIAPFLLILIVFSCYPTKSKKFEAEDIEQTMRDYRQAWMDGDSSRVLGMISDDIILFMPDREGKPIQGKEAVREFWFPKTDLSYPILNYEALETEIGGGDQHAYYQGISRLTWCTVENGVGRDTMTSISDFTTLLKMDGDQWKISRLMYVSKNTGYLR